MINYKLSPCLSSSSSSSSNGHSGRYGHFGAFTPAHPLDDFKQPCVHHIFSAGSAQKAQRSPVAVAVWLLRKWCTSLLLNCCCAGRCQHSNSDGSRGTMRTAADTKWRPIRVYSTIILVFKTKAYVSQWSCRSDVCTNYILLHHVNFLLHFSCRHTA